MSSKEYPLSMDSNKLLSDLAKTLSRNWAVIDPTSVMQKCLDYISNRDLKDMVQRCVEKDENECDHCPLRHRRPSDCITALLVDIYRDISFNSSSIN